MSKNYRIFLLAMFLAQAVSAQEFMLPEAVPPSPEAASVAKYGAVPVSSYTGKPNINVPFYTLKSRYLSVPISLSYDASGIKVEEIASRVGLGWSLNAGGVITRTVRGEPDFGGNCSDPPFYNQADSASFEVLKKIASGEEDGTPDSYYFSFPGQSGSFIATQAGMGFSIPYQNLKIERIYGGWRIVDENGVQYLFESAEQTSLKSVCQSTEKFNNKSQENIKSYESAWYLTRIIAPGTVDTVNFEYEPFETSYRLPASRTRYHLESKNDPYCWAWEDQYEINCDQTFSLKGLRLKKITSLSGSLTFDAAIDRGDLPGDKAITNIRMFDKDGDYLKEFILDYGYFYSPWYPYGHLTPWNNVRLQLKSVREISKTCHALGSTQFAYNDSIAIPHRLSYAQDHWGYYNGQDNNTMYVPETNATVVIKDKPYWVVNSPVEPKFTFLPGANREPSAPHMQAWTLKKIIWPTGGSTEFELEPHDYSEGADSKKIVAVQQKSVQVNNNDDPILKKLGVKTFQISSDKPADAELIAAFGGSPASKVRILEDASNEVIYTADEATFSFGQTIWLYPNTTYRIEAEVPDKFSYASLTVQWWEPQYEVDPPANNKIAGGLRIRKITDYDGISHERDVVRTYNYRHEPFAQISSGILLSKPSYLYNIVNSNNPNSCNDINDKELEDFVCHLKYLARSSSSTYPLSTTQGSHVGYGTVMVKHGKDGENGKTVYRYTTAKEYPDNVFMVPPFAPPVTNDWKRGLLLDQRDYDAVGKIKRSLQNSYEFQDDPKNPWHQDMYEAYRCVAGLKVGLVHSMRIACNPKMFKYPYTQFVQQGYQLVSAAVYKTKTVERVYDQGDETKFTERTLTFGHNYEAQVRTVTEKKSDGAEEITRIVYPHDFTFPLNVDYDKNALALQWMSKQHVQNKPVEVVTSLKRPGQLTPVITSASLYKYRTFFGKKLEEQYDQDEWEAYIASEQGVPDEILELKTLPGKKSYQWAAVENGVFKHDPDFRPVLHFDRYDSLGHALQVRTPGGLVSGTVWGYNHTLPVAAFDNAGYDDVAYTSFENKGPESWTFNVADVQNTAYVGERSLKLTQPCTLKFQGSEGTYLLSFWARGTGTVLLNEGQDGQTVVDTAGWTYRQFVVQLKKGDTPVLKASGNVLIDELCLKPREASLRTSAYRPMTGVSDVADLRGTAVHYRRDAFGRLRFTENFRGELAAEYRYNHQNAPDNKSITLNFYPEIAGEVIVEPYEALAGQAILFTGVAWSGCGENTFEWDFGDGKIVKTKNTTVNHAYAQPGVYAVKLRVTNPEYLVPGEKVKNITVKAFAPLKMFLEGPSSLAPGQTGLIAAKASDGLPPYTYAWERKEGLNGAWLPLPDVSSSVSPKAGNTGPFFIRCTVKDQANSAVVAERKVEVLPCEGDDKKMINGVCVQGQLTDIQCEQVVPNKCVCTYEYYFQEDGSYKQVQKVFQGLCEQQP